MIAPTKQSRPKKFVFVFAMTALTCTAFATGKYWRDQVNFSQRISPAQEMRLAQVGEPSVTPGRITLDKSKTRDADKRLRAAVDTFSQVHTLVREEYVDALPSEQVMSQGAIRSMLSALEDEQSYFLTSTERRVFEAEYTGHFAGMGAVTAIRSVKARAGYTELHLMVVAPLPGSPAEKAGLRTGDRITYLDGRYIIGDNPLFDTQQTPKAQSHTNTNRCDPMGGSSRCPYSKWGGGDNRTNAASTGSDRHTHAHCRTTGGGHIPSL